MSISKDADLVKFKHNLKQSQKSDEIEKYILDKLFNLPNYMDYKFDPELVLYACRVVEALVKKSDHIDKKMLVISVFEKIFNLSYEEKKLIEEIIEFLFNNKRIKAVKTTKKVLYAVGDWVKRKLL